MDLEAVTSRIKTHLLYIGYMSRLAVIKIKRKLRFVDWRRKAQSALPLNDSLGLTLY